MLPDGAAHKLRLNRHPQNADFVTLLKRSPPEDETMARNWFEILSHCVLGRLFHLLASGSDLLFSLARRVLYRLSRKALGDALYTRRVHRIQG